MYPHSPQHRDVQRTSQPAGFSSLVSRDYAKPAHTIRTTVRIGMPIVLMLILILLGTSLMKITDMTKQQRQ
jgi:hypothetical protein